MNRRRALGVGGVAAVALAGALVWWQPWNGHGSDADRVAAAVSTTTAATAEPTTTTVPAAVTLAPLTGLPVPEERVASLVRPALVAKIDGAAQAMPQVGLGTADVVLEVRVEGISRYLAVWHSQDVQDIGPVRSARTTDPDLLAMFGHPLFAFSGGNSGVLAAVGSSSWQQSVSHDVAPGAHRRTTVKRPPHNLIADAPELWSLAEDPVQLPTPLFLTPPPAAVADPPGPGDPVPEEPDPAPGEPVPGVTVPVGSGATFAWDAERGGWLRWAHGIPHRSVDSTEGSTGGGEQLAPTNVVVLETSYVSSPADDRSPEAVSLGNGRAWVLSGGTMQDGTWTRDDRTRPWDLRDASGAPMVLDAGTTWVVLADGAPTVLDAAAVQALPR